jgi:hypothetical protein
MGHQQDEAVIAPPALPFGLVAGERDLVVELIGAFVPMLLHRDVE